MADREDKLPDNAPGRLYVDGQCIDCDLCRQTAPENFDRNDNEGYTYVNRQPETKEEREQCQEALDECPVEAIGDDG